MEYVNVNLYARSKADSISITSDDSHQREWGPIRRKIGSYTGNVSLKICIASSIFDSAAQMGYLVHICRTTVLFLRCPSVKP